MLKITCLGGASSVGASATLVEVADKAFLIDCGIRFRQDSPLPHLDALAGKSLDAILVTHAHTDHTGALPLAHLASPGTPVFMTPPTVDLCRILFRDSLKLMDLAEREAELPLYRKEDVESLFSAIRPVSPGEVLRFGDVEVRFLPAGHILGASLIHIATPSGHVLFTGDFSVSPQQTVEGLEIPHLPVDVLVSESTYGNRLHSDRTVTEKLFLQKVASVLERQGRVLIPAFALGRAQEILVLLRRALENQTLPEVPVFADGMVRHMCGAYKAHEAYLHPLFQKRLRFGGDPFLSDLVRAVGWEKEARRQVLDAGPAVIVASSGMLTGGPSTFYAAALAPHKEDAILLSGYQDEESPGRALMNLAALPQGSRRQLSLPQGVVPVVCEFGSYSLSAHADALQIVALAERLAPRCVVLVHGDDEARAALAKKLQLPDVVLAQEGTPIERSYSVRKLTGENAKSPTKAPKPLKPGSENTGMKTLQAFCDAKMLPPPSIHVRSHPEGRVSAQLLLQIFDHAFEANGEGESSAEAQNQAAQRLMAELSGKEEVLAEIVAMRIRLVTRDEERLKVENPKGRLLETLLAHGVRETPEFTIYGRGQAHEKIFVGMGSLTFRGAGLRSRVFVYSRQKTIEAAISADLLAQVEKVFLAGKTPTSETPAAPEISAQALPQTVLIERLGQNPRMWLNELRMKKLIRDFGYTPAGRSGPSHAPLFSFGGFVIFLDGTKREVGPFSAASHKAAEALCAESLAIILIEQGF